MQMNLQIPQMQQECFYIESIYTFFIRVAISTKSFRASHRVRRVSFANSLSLAIN